jgi:membrane fusion protein (multidrug efflux system)
MVALVATLQERAPATKRIAFMSTSTPAVSATPEITVEGPAAAAPAKAKKLPVIPIVLVTALGLGGGGWLLAHRGLETTDDAQIDADVIAVPSRTAGAVAKVYVSENQAVEAGDLLAELDAEPAKARLAQAVAMVEAAQAGADAADADARVAEINVRGNKSVAEAALQGASSLAGASRQQIAEGVAQVASAQATRDKASGDLDRTKTLIAGGALAGSQIEQAQAVFSTADAALAQAKAHLASLQASTSTAVSRVQEANAKLTQSSDVDALIDQARAKARTAHAQVRTAEAARDLAALELTYTKIVAPQRGTASKKTIAVGQMVAPGQTIVQIVSAQSAWVTGNFKETQVGRLRVGQVTEVEIDAFPGVKLHGEVESFSGATGARFSLLPPDNATGNFTKVVQRVPVRIRLHDVPQSVLLRPGMSVELSVDTRK